jgi:hypothetical protein
MATSNSEQQPGTWAWGTTSQLQVPSRSDLLAEVIAAGVVEGGGVHVRGWGRGGGNEAQRAEGEGQRHWVFQCQPGVGWAVGRVVRGRGRTTGLRGPQNTPTGSRGQRARARELAAAAADINLRGMELDSAADLAVLGGDGGFKLSHTDLSSPAQPWAGAPPVALAEPFS